MFASVRCAFFPCPVVFPVLCDRSHRILQPIPALKTVFIAVIFASSASAGDIGYYRVASTQETTILSLSTDGTLTWMNSATDAPCRVDWTFWFDGCWMTNFSFTNDVSEGAIRVTRVPVPECIPNHCRCAHNLWLIKRAIKQCQQDLGREDWDSVTLDMLLPYLPSPPPTCPDFGYYAITTFGNDPYCSIGGEHRVPYLALPAPGGGSSPLLTDTLENSLAKVKKIRPERASLLRSPSRR